MPFGPYGSFDECVSKNQDKSSPEGFCAWLEHETTGQWPGEMKLLVGMPADLKVLFLEHFGAEMKSGKGEVVALANAHKVVTEAGWEQKNNEWRKYQAMPSHTIRDVEIFAVGEHNGDIFSQEDLDSIIEAFYALRGRIDPPLKLGHSSDKFNKEIAKRLGLPGGVVTGDKGEGALAFGWVDNLRRYDNILVADFVKVPEAIATLIESQLYRHVSCELSVDFDDGGSVYPFILSGVALLGEEMPAVSEIKGLEKAMIYVGALPNKARHYTSELKRGDMDKEEETKFWNELINKIKGFFGKGGNRGKEEPPEEEGQKESNELKEADMLKEVFKALDLPEDSKVEDAVAFIAKLKASNEGIFRTSKGYTDLEAQVKTFKERAETAEAKIKVQDRAARIVKYTVLASGWKAIAGKPEDIAERIVALEDIDSNAANELVKTYAALNQSAVAVGLIKPLGTSVEGDVKNPFEQKVEQLQEEKNADGSRRYKSYPEAVRAASEQFPALYKEYRKQQSK